MTIKFVLCEASYEDNSAIENILSVCGDGVYKFIDGSFAYFNSDLAIKFDDYDKANLLRQQAWNNDKVNLGIAIWDSRYPDEVDYSYVQFGKSKNLVVKANRETE